MLNQDIWDGYETRIKMLNPFFSFGKGIHLSSNVQPYVENILLAVLLEVFYREVRNNEARTERDIIEIVKEIFEEMKLEVIDKEAARLVTGLLYSNPQTLEAFARPYFTTKTRQFEMHQFKYLIPDLDVMGEDATSIIYKLSDVAQFILFSSREITAELSISLEQLYMIQLLDKGNIDGVLKQTDFLLQRVRNLISKEIEYGREIGREPKIILREGFDDKSKREEEIKRQFEEEDENFEKMHKLLKRLEEKNEGLHDEKAKIRMHEIRDRLTQATNKHAELNTLVTGNIAYIIDIRTNRPDLLMKKSSKRFKEDIWEQLIKVEGIPNEYVLEELLHPFFSPMTPRLFSIDMLWVKQKVTKHKKQIVEKEDVELIEHKTFKYILNWKNILEKWIPILDELIANGSFSLHMLESLEGWTKDAIEIWFQFTMRPFRIPSNILTSEIYDDEREEFIKQVISYDNKYRILLGCTLKTNKRNNAIIEYNDSVILTDSTLYLKTNSERMESNAK